MVVNGKRVERHESDDEQMKIEIDVPENSVQDITITVITLDKEEKSLYGKIKVLQRTQFTPQSGAMSSIPIAQENPEIYESILRHGYGELTVREHVIDPAKTDMKDKQNDTAAVMVAQLILGIKQDTSKIEFRFSENSGAYLDGKASVALYLDEDTKHNLNLAIDEGAVQLQAILEVYQQTPYTLHAPVWINLDEQTKEYLRARGGHAKIALCTPSAQPGSDTEFVKVLGSNEDPVSVAAKHGTLVGLLDIKRVN